MEREKRREKVRERGEKVGEKGERERLMNCFERELGEASRRRRLCAGTSRTRVTLSQRSCGVRW